MKKINAYFHKNLGFANAVFLLFLTGSTIMVSHQVRMNNQERKFFYGKDISPNKEQQLLANKIFYFDFNSYQIKTSNKLPLYAHARYLLKNPKLNLLVTGHTDQKGSIEYNFKLGILRAAAIADLLICKGVNPNRITIVSYANQVPINRNLEHDYNKIKLDQKNRRSEIKYITLLNDNLN